MVYSQFIPTKQNINWSLYNEYDSKELSLISTT